MDADDHHSLLHDKLETPFGMKFTNGGLLDRFKTRETRFETDSGYHEKPWDPLPDYQPKSAREPMISSSWEVKRIWKTGNWDPDIHYYQGRGFHTTQGGLASKIIPVMHQITSPGTRVLVQVSGIMYSYSWFRLTRRIILVLWEKVSRGTCTMSGKCGSQELSHLNREIRGALEVVNYGGHLW